MSYPYVMNLSEATVVITGASAGIGREMARRFAERGARIFGLARREERLEELGDELGDAFTGVRCDVTDERAVTDAFGEIREESERIDVLVNNAGFGAFGELDSFDLDTWDDLFDTNVRGVFLCTQQVIPLMRAQNEAEGFGGHIVNIASIAGLIGNPKIGAYNATKFSVRGLSESMMKELRGDGIKVTCIYPGSIETEFFEVAGSDLTSNPLQPEDVAASVLHVVDSPPNHLVSEVVMRPLRPRG